MCAPEGNMSASGIFWFHNGAVNWVSSSVLMFLFSVYWNEYFMWENTWAVPTYKLGQCQCTSLVCLVILISALCFDDFCTLDMGDLLCKKPASKSSHLPQRWFAQKWCSKTVQLVWEARIGWLCIMAPSSIIGGGVPPLHLILSDPYHPGNVRYREVHNGQACASHKHSFRRALV